MRSREGGYVRLQFQGDAEVLASCLFCVAKELNGETKERKFLKMLDKNSPEAVSAKNYSPGNYSLSSIQIRGPVR
jgi:hypothetical protein